MIHAVDSGNVIFLFIAVRLLCFGFQSAINCGYITTCINCHKYKSSDNYRSFLEIALYALQLYKIVMGFRISPG